MGIVDSPGFLNHAGVNLTQLYQLEVPAIRSPTRMTDVVGNWAAFLASSTVLVAVDRPVPSNPSEFMCWTRYILLRYDQPV